jgi:hypothetical protein
MQNTYHQQIARSFIHSEFSQLQLRDNYEPEIMENVTSIYFVSIKQDAPIAKIKKWYFETTGQPFPEYSVLKEMHEYSEEQRMKRVKTNWLEYAMHHNIDLKIADYCREVLNLCEVTDCKGNILESVNPLPLKIPHGMNVTDKQASQILKNCSAFIGKAIIAN